jgi:23S rRNA pseudouridine955/2504/2580 synthase
MTIDDEQSGQRLDNFLVTALKGVPRSHIYKIVRRGEVRINRGRCRANYRLRRGDQVRIPPVRVASREAPPRLERRDQQTLERAILYEDKYLLAVNKPSGMAVHGGSGIALGVIEALRQLRPTEPGLELVHRLDRDTSGCLLVAKRRSALRRLHEQLRQHGPRGVDKRYLALLEGHWRGGKRRVQAALKKNLLQSGERIVRVAEDGKPSVSVFVPRQRYPQATLVEISLLTGRTHQARVHAAHMGMPIAGDDKYGHREFNKSMRGLGLKRLFLHAASLTFEHPDSGERLRIEAPLPAELENVLEQLKAEHA